MPATPSDLFAFLDRLGIAHATVTHPALFTVEQSQQLRGTIPGGHTKNLFLKDKKGALFLVTALEDAVIELKSLHRRLAASGRFSFGPADLMRATLGIAHATVTHPALFTVEQSRELRGTIPGGHTKNLFLKDKKGALFLVTALEDAVIELKSLHRRLAASGRFSFGPADLMRATLGIEPGAVTPFAAMNDAERRVSVVLDAALMRHETINCHPLVNTMTTSIARADLVRFLESTGHPPRIAALAEQETPPSD